MPTRSLRTTLAILALTCALGAGPGHAQGPAAAGQPAQLSRFGMNTYFTGLERNGRDGDAGVGTLIGRGRQMGATWAREELSWANLERDGKGRWLWSHFDRRLLETAQAGYGIVGMLLTTPAWARVSDCGARTSAYASEGVTALDYWCPPANPQDFADYVAATVERYDGDGAVMVGQIGEAAFAGSGQLHSFAHDPGRPNPEARYHLRFRTDSAQIDLLWRNAGSEEVALPLLRGGEPQVLTRDGAPLPARIEGGVARFSIGEAPVYVRQRAWPVVTRLTLPVLYR